jgi:hypothetical protein
VEVVGGAAAALAEGVVKGKKQVMFKKKLGRSKKDPITRSDNSDDPNQQQGWFLLFPIDVYYE